MMTFVDDGPTDPNDPPPPPRCTICGKMGCPGHPETATEIRRGSL